ncbi:MAG: alpha/beta hydrolase [Oscillospiraceae bacterium]|nr:alpha/beta hydrolase [Oscillospiraceae bacterium]
MFQHVNGIELYYEVKGNGRPLLMVHGNGEDHTIFDEASEILKDRFTVYLVDSRDHGQSTKVSDLHYSDMADDLLVFLNGLDLKDVTFYGFSDGGILGLLLAQKTDRISRLIVSGANMTPNGVKGWLKTVIKIIYFFNKDSKLRMMLREPNITAEELSSIKVPTTVIAGEKDLVIRKETEAIAAAIPGSKLRIIKGEGHGSYIVHKTAVADLILEETAQN